MLFCVVVCCLLLCVVCYMSLLVPVACSWYALFVVVSGVVSS